ncbi:MAG: PilZ domain-containing protein [Pseudomonadota bacterium]|nr:PilZ domain-containing protein [Pseudomonadota bacterium]
MLQYSSNPVDLTAQLATAPGAENARKAERQPVEMGAGLRQRGASGVTVAILDLSTHGFRASTHLDLMPGADVWLKLPGLEALHAKVMWANAHYVGCAFEKPLHPAVLQMVVSR